METLNIIVQTSWDLYDILRLGHVFNEYRSCLECDIPARVLRARDVFMIYDLVKSAISSIAMALSVSLCMCVSVSVCVTFVSKGRILSKRKNVKTTFLYFWYLPSKTVIAKMLSPDLDLFLDCQTFETLISVKSIELEMYGTTFVDWHLPSKDNMAKITPWLRPTFWK